MPLPSGEDGAAELSPSEFGIIVPPIRHIGLAEFALDAPGLLCPPPEVVGKVMELPGSRDRLRSSELRRDPAKVGRRRPIVLTRLPMLKEGSPPSSLVTPRDSVRGR